MLTFIGEKVNKNLVLFIHGFIGGKETWIRNDGKTSILDYLKDDDSISGKYDFAVFDYFSKISDLFVKINWVLRFLFGSKTTMKKNIPVEDIGQILQSEIKYNCSNYSQIILIAHSMGGLVSKSYILEEIKNNRTTPVKLFISLAVPHRGSELATFGKLIAGNPQISDLGPLAKIINNMNDEWIRVAEQLPETLYVQGKNDEIVPYVSTISVDTRNKEIVYTDDDHFSIVHPESKDDVAITAIKDRCLKLANESKTNDDTAVKVINVSDNVQNELIFNFKPDFRADIISVADSINKMLRGKENNFKFKINWSSEIAKAIESCQYVYEQAKNHLNNSSLFYNGDEKLIESIINVVPSSLGSAEVILHNAHKRIIPLITGMSHERQNILGCKMTISNYLTHCNFYIVKTVLYPLTHILLKDTKYSYRSIVNEFDEKLFRDKEFYQYVYGMGKNIESASLWYLADENKEEIANIKYGLYIVGNKEDLDGTSGNYDFYDSIFVPQIEFQLITKEEVVLYNKDRNLYLKEHRTVL